MQWTSWKFQSTPPVKAATKDGAVPVVWARFQSTPPVKAATELWAFTPDFIAISIHAAREGGDRQHIHPTRMLTCISIHAAREGGDVYLQTSAEVDANISIHAAREGGDHVRIFIC